MNETTQHSIVSCLALVVLGVLGWRGADVSYAVTGVVAAVVGGHAMSGFSVRRGDVAVSTTSTPTALTSGG